MTAAPDRLFDRSAPARVGIAALNLLLPGLGLVRLGHAREGGPIAAGALLAIWILAGVALVMPVGTFAMQGLILSLFWLIYLVFVLISVALTWQKSRRDADQHWWSRWYAILLWWIVGVVSSVGSSALLHMSYKPFYVASVSMKPTFEKNEKLVGDMRWRTPVVGNIVLVRDHDGTTRIYRVAAIGGQTFTMRNGIPIIDGRLAKQVVIEPISFTEGGLGAQSGHVLREQLPGEKGSHRIIRLDGNGLNEFPEVRIPVGHVFLLGDDRDLAADSRVPPEQVGVGIMPVSAITGRPLYITWSRDRSRIGMPADH